jgi:hypothetical protein
VVGFAKVGRRLLKISSDATIADITHLLADPVEYVRRIMENMMSGPYDRDDAVVRIGVSGKGVAPNYRIEYPNQPELASLGLAVGADTYSGIGHKELGHYGQRGEQWSTRAMLYTDLRGLIGTLRAKRKSG